MRKLALLLILASCAKLRAEDLTGEAILRMAL
jgi:hypothetical protein